MNFFFLSRCDIIQFIRDRLCWSRILSHNSQSPIIRNGSTIIICFSSLSFLFKTLKTIKAPALFSFAMDVQTLWNPLNVMLLLENASLQKESWQAPSFKPLLIFSMAKSQLQKKPQIIVWKDSYLLSSIRLLIYRTRYRHMTRTLLPPLIIPHLPPPISHSLLPTAASLPIETLLRRLSKLRKPALPFQACNSKEVFHRILSALSGHCKSKVSKTSE